VQQKITCLQFDKLTAGGTCKKREVNTPSPRTPRYLFVELLGASI
jgi:hypothetical protein